MAAASVNYLSLCGIVLSGYKLVEQACEARQMLNAEVAPENREFLEAKVISAQFYCTQMLPRALAYEQMIVAGSTSVLDAKL